MLNNVNIRNSSKKHSILIIIVTLFRIKIFEVHYKNFLKLVYMVLTSCITT